MASFLPLTSKPYIKSGNIPRIVLISAFTVTIAILLCSLKMLMTFLLCPLTPIIQLNNLIVSNFSVSDSNLAAIWLANITIYNPNVALSLQMNQIEASILYRHDSALSLSSVEDLELGFMERKDVYVKFVTTEPEGDQPIVEYPVLREIEKERRQGKVRFRIRLDAMTRYEIDWPGRRKTVSNMDLDVYVGDGRDISNIIGDVPKDGSLLMMVAD
ncbi:hypothetical protein PTKIN_Ptkin07bG0251500 [Pterospermum kingtungense]